MKTQTIFPLTFISQFGPKIDLTTVLCNNGIRSFSMVNPIGSMNNLSELSCKLYMKEILENISRSQRRYGEFINA